MTSRARSRSWLLLSPLALLLFAGCYGSTDPATDIGPESATLHARGTADKGEAHSYFQFWITGTSRVRWTEQQKWPAGASGPFSQPATGLAASTSYSFRICGGDGPFVGGNEVCANTRTFKTGAPVEDSAIGAWGASPSFAGSVSAHSGRSGQSPQGSMGGRIGFDYFEGSVTCLRVSGDRAVVGAVGLNHEQSQQGYPASQLMTIVDGGSGDDKIDVRPPQPGSTPPNCASATFGQEGVVTFGPYLGELVVNDAP